MFVSPYPQPYTGGRRTAIPTSDSGQFAYYGHETCSAHCSSTHVFTRNHDMHIASLSREIDCVSDSIAGLFRWCKRATSRDTCWQGCRNCHFRSWAARFVLAHRHGVNPLVQPAFNSFYCLLFFSFLRVVCVVICVLFSYRNYRGSNRIPYSGWS